MSARVRPWLIGAVGGFLLGGVVGVGVALVVVTWGPRLARRHRRAAEVRRCDADLATLLELAARGVRNGESPLAALHATAATVGGPAGRLVADLVDLASEVPLAVAAQRWVRRHDGGAVPVIAATMALVGSGEAGSARAFEAAAAHLRTVERVGAEAEMWATQARTSAAVLVGAPALLGGAALVFEPSMVRRLAGAPIALTVVVCGVALSVTGAWWMARLVGDVDGDHR